MGYNTKEFEEKLKKTITAYENNLDNIRASQANPKLLSRISFEYYGSPTPLNTMADIRVTDARTLTIMPYDKTTLKAIEKAIEILKANGEDAYVIGEIIKSDEGVILC